MRELEQRVRKLIWLKERKLTGFANLIRENQELRRNPMNSSDSHTNSKYKSPFGCRAGAARATV